MRTNGTSQKLMFCVYYDNQTNISRRTIINKSKAECNGRCNNGGKTHTCFRSLDTVLILSVLVLQIGDVSKHVSVFVEGMSM